jgi:hypothetical protein
MQNAELFLVEKDCSYSYHAALKGYIGEGAKLRVTLSTVGGQGVQHPPIKRIQLPAGRDARSVWNVSGLYLSQASSHPAPNNITCALHAVS